MKIEEHKNEDNHTKLYRELMNNTISMAEYLDKRYDPFIDFPTKDPTDVHIKRVIEDVSYERKPRTKIHVRTITDFFKESKPVTKTDIHLFSSPFTRRTIEQAMGRGIRTNSHVDESVKIKTCYDVISLISDEDAILMGFDPTKTRLGDMIMTTEKLNIQNKNGLYNIEKRIVDFDNPDQIKIRNEFPGLTDDQYADILKAKKLGIERKMIKIQNEINEIKKELNNINFHNFYVRNIDEIKTTYPELSICLYLKMMHASWNNTYGAMVVELGNQLIMLTKEYEILAK